MGCDICGKSGVYLQDLKAPFQTEDIKEICDDCNRQLTKHNQKLHDLTFKIKQRWIKTFMAHLKEKLDQTRLPETSTETPMPKVKPPLDVLGEQILEALKGANTIEVDLETLIKFESYLEKKVMDIRLNIEINRNKAILKLIG